MKTPTNEQVEAAVARLGKPGAATYFFDNLKNPLWITPLYERGYFKRPPPAERDTSDGSISFPDWPELRYLIRMVSIAPEEVGQIVLAISDTDNARVRQLMVEVGVLLPRALSRRLGERASRWLEEPFVRGHFDTAFSSLISHLADLHEFQAAISLAKGLFKVEEEPSKGRRAHALDAWHVDHYLKQCVPALLKADALATLEFLRDRLLAATKEPSAVGEDYSYIWRREIASPNYHVGEVKDVFVNWVRDVSLSLARDSAVGPTKVYNTLLRRRRPILTRIIMYVAAEIGDSRDPLVMQLLLDHSLIDRYTCRAEYRKLLQATFAGLPEQDQSQLIARLQNDLLESIPESVQRELSPEKLQRFSKQTERDRLLAFGSLLPASLKPRLDQLLQDEGEPFEERGVVTRFGPMSPLSRDELNAMTVAEILQYIDKGVPPDGLEEGGRVGLGQALHEITKSRVDEFSKEAGLWVGREPVYVRWVMMGFSDVIKNRGRIDDWRSVLKLSEWVVHRPDPPPSQGDNPWRDFDAGWVGARQSVAQLLNNGMENVDSGLSLALRAEVWVILEQLLKDSDPAPREVEDSTTDSDPLSVSINTVRGWATHALFRYMWWVHKDPAIPNDFPSFNRMPEALAALESTLRDASPAIRSVLGDWYRTILYFDAAWAAKHLDDVFPESVENASMWYAGWGTFVTYSPPYDPGYDVLHRKYALGVARLREVDSQTRKRMGEAGLGQHLASYFWRAVGGDRVHDLVLQYFDNASPESAGQIVAWFGRGLQQSAEPVAETTVVSLVSLWGELRAREQQWHERKRRQVLRKFGEWFPSERLPSRWAINSLEECLRVGVGIESLEDVLERLTAVVPWHPHEVAVCLELLLKDNRQLWHPISWQQGVESLLTALFRVDDSAVREKALEIVNRLVEGGSLFARDVAARTARN